MRTLRFLLLTLTAAYAASAGTVYNVQVDTARLALSGSSFFMDFQFIGNDGNIVNLTNFSYGVGGSGPAGPFELDTITNVFNEVTQIFTPGAKLSFDIVAPTNIAPPAGGFPDELSFFLLDSSGNALSTSDTGSAFLYLDVTGGQANIQTFNGSGVNDPVLTASGTPEPATLPMLAIGLGLVMLSGARSWRREH